MCVCVCVCLHTDDNCEHCEHYSVTNLRRSVAMENGSCSVIDGVHNIAGVPSYLELNLIHSSVQVLEDVGTMVQPHGPLLLCEGVRV